MKGNLTDPKQGNESGPKLKEIANPTEDLVVFADRIDWDFFEKEFLPLYLSTGRPAVPIRVMVSFLLLQDYTIMEMKR